MWEDKNKQIEYTIIIVRICFQIHNIRDIKYSLKQILKQEVLPVTTKSWFNYEFLISKSHEAHDIARQIIIVYTL